MTKLTDASITKVTTLDDTSLFYAVDPTRAVNDKDVGITKANLKTELAPTTPTLQEVTTQGASTTDAITIQNELTVGDGAETIINTTDGSIEDDGGAMTIRHTSSITLNSPTLRKTNGEEIASFNGDWNATTNTPTLANTDTNKKAIEYKVSAAGSVDFGAGSITFAIGDIVANDGTIWYKKAGEYQSDDNTNERLRTYVIPSDFDFTSIDSSYANAVWKIRFVHDLSGANITLPNNVTLRFEGGRITNYGTITVDETRIDFNSTYPIFDGSGDFDGQPKSVKNFITPIHFGAIGDGSTDSTNAFNKCAEFVGSQNVDFINEGRPSYNFPKDIQEVEVVVPSGIYLITDEIILRAGQIWIGNRNSTLLLFNPSLKTLTGTIDDYIQLKEDEQLIDYSVENTYADRDALLADQGNQTNRNYQSVTDARTDQEVIDGDPVYSANFQLYLNKNLIVADGDIDTFYNYTDNVMENIRFKGFTLTGDVLYDGTGNAGNAIYTNNASQLLFEDLYITKFERGVSVNIGIVARAAYYNKFKNIHVQYVRQALFMGQGTAVTSFENSIFVARPETTAKYTHLIELYNNTTFLNCSFEGASPTNPCIHAPIGKLTIVGGRDESNTLLKYNGRGVTGGVSVILPNGVTGGFGEVTNIDDAPLTADMNDDQNVLTQNNFFGQGVAKEVKMLKNQSWKLGFSGWLEDGSSGYYEYINDRADLMGSTSGIKITKTTGGSYAITQTLKLNSPKTYATVWAKSSNDAILRTQFGILKASDDAVTNYLKEFIPMLTMGDWTLYVASVAHYYKDVPNADPRPYLGLNSSSPDGSWVIFSNLRFFTGGYSLFSGSDTEAVEKEFILSEPPTEGFIKNGDRVYYDGTSGSYPITLEGAKGVQCNFNLETTSSTSVLSGNNSFDITTSTNVSAGDYIGIWGNDGQMTWTTIDSISTNTVTLVDNVVSDADSGNKVYIFRLINIGQITAPEGTLVYQGEWNPNTNTPTLNDNDTGVKGYVYKVSETGTANLGLGLDSDVFNTGTISNTGNTTASFSGTGLDATSDGTGLVLRPRVLWNSLNIGNNYQLDITSITVNSGSNPTYSLYDGTAYQRNNVSLVTETIEFTANSTNVFFTLDGTGTFDVSIDVTLKEVITNASTTYTQNEKIFNNGEYYEVL